MLGCNSNDNFMEIHHILKTMLVSVPRVNKQLLTLAVGQREEAPVC